MQLHIQGQCQNGLRLEDALRVSTYIDFKNQNTYNNNQGPQTQRYGKLRFGYAVSPRLSGWLGPDKVPDNRKKIPVLDYRDCGIARIY